MTLADANIDEAIEYCRDITRRRARNFYYGLKLLPEPKRSALYAVYAWMRKADDIVDTAEGGASEVRGRIEFFRRMTEQTFAGEAVNGDLLWPALRQAVEQFPIRLVDFLSMLDGQLSDLSQTQYESFESLHEYCAQVASSVGLICIEIWGYSHERARALAHDRGIAFQLTNILRDFRQDYNAGRVYLPCEDFRQSGISACDLMEWTDPARCNQFLTAQIERARSYYERSADLQRLIDTSCVPTLWAMTTIYRALLEKMANAPQQIVHGPRIRLSTLKKGSIAIQAKFNSPSKALNVW